MPTIHRNTGKIKSKVSGIVENFVKSRLMPIITKNLDFCEEFTQDKPDLLELRKRLRDELNAAFYGKDDRVMHFLETGESTRKGHEPMMVLMAILIDYHMDEQLRELVKRSEYY